MKHPHRRAHLTPVVMLALAALWACDAARLGDEEYAYLVEHLGLSPDSLDRVVFSMSPSLTDSWRVADQPSLQIGELDGPPATIFTTVASTLRLSDGRIVVVDGRAGELRYFTESGDHVRTTGGRGQGPGEFDLIGGLIPLRGDSVLVSDLGLRRVTIFDESGALVSTTVISSPEEPLQPSVVARLDDGSYLVQAVAAAMYLYSGEGVGREAGWIWHMSGRGNPVARVSPYEGVLSRFSATSSGAIPFSSYDVVVSWNGRVTHGDRDTYTFRAYDLDGSVERIVTRRTLLEPITEDDVVQLCERFRTMCTAGDSEHMPKTHAAFGPVIVDRVGNLWVGEYDPRPEGLISPRPTSATIAATWSVFDREGSWLTDVEMPDGLRVMDIGDTYVLGTVMGEFRELYVRMYVLAK